MATTTKKKTVGKKTVGAKPQGKKTAAKYVNYEALDREFEEWLEYKVLSSEHTIEKMTGQINTMGRGLSFATMAGLIAHHLGRLQAIDEYLTGNNKGHDFAKWREAYGVVQSKKLENSPKAANHNSQVWGPLVHKSIDGMKKEGYFEMQEEIAEKWMELLH